MSTPPNPYQMPGAAGSAAARYDIDVSRGALPSGYGGTGGNFYWGNYTSGGTRTSNPLVYQGPQRPAERIPSGTPAQYSYQQALFAPLDWSDKEVDRFIHDGILRKIPGFSEDMGLPEVVAQWQDFVNNANDSQRAGHMISPWDFFNSYRSREGQTYRKGDWLYDAVSGQPIKYVGPRTKTTTATNIQELTREDALALTKDSMSRLLGRAPTDSEVSTYLATLNGYNRENPQVTTTTQTLNEQGEVVSTSSRTKGGPSAAGQQALVEERLKEDEEYGAFQASTTYFNALMGMLGGS